MASGTFAHFFFFFALNADPERFMDKYVLVERLPKGPRIVAEGLSKGKKLLPAGCAGC